ncbi:MAG: asparagine synthase (glutamine-hydrolyzing) [Desulfobacter sp.]|nr:MAG: asparagine synthase (glutamine-hydrolyzing) [Desulfobacter sp.]
MCGIAGSYSYSPDAIPVSQEVVLAMSDYMKKRGPDGSGCWFCENNRVGLVHRRLAIIDPTESAAQPMAGANGNIHIVFNGEIYNYKSLRDTLSQKGYTFRTNSDTEVLLCLYDCYGLDMVHYLRGMFAFAIWDDNAKRLVIGRDPFGIKPLYYSNDRGRVVFASQVKALLQDPEVPRDPEPAGHIGFFVLGSVPEPYTLYKSIKALPAGCLLVATEEKGCEIRQYHDLKNTILSSNPWGDKKKFSSGPADYFRKACIDTVNHHLVSDVPVGLFLSAGIDSAVLLALASEGNYRDQIKTLTLSFQEFKGSEKDEGPLAAELAEVFRTDHHTFCPSENEFRGDIDSLLHAMDQPTIDGVNVYFVSKYAAKAGLKVAISGLGGDEVLGGYSTYSQIPACRNFFNSIYKIPGLKRFGSFCSSKVLKKHLPPKYSGLIEFGDTLGGAYFVHRGLFMPWELFDIFEPSFVEDGFKALQLLPNLQETTSDLPMGWSSIAALEISWYMRNQLLRDADWAGMAHSVEIRVPLVDTVFFKKIIECRANGFLPGKKEFAYTAKQKLPKKFLERRKTGFSIPVERWVVSNGKTGYQERGLRGWAKHVYSFQTGNSVVS